MLKFLLLRGQHGHDPHQTCSSLDDGDAQHHHGCFIHPDTLQRIINGDFGFPVTPELLLLFSIIFLSLVLPIKTIRWVSTLAVVLTALFVVGGGSATPLYFFFATLELASMVAVLWYVWKELAKTLSPSIIAR
jgi:hypothetical protein